MNPKTPKLNLNDARRALFAACKTLGMDDDERRALILQLTGCASTRDLTPPQWRAVLDHLNKITGYHGQRANEWAWVDEASVVLRPTLRRLIVLSKSAGIARGKQMAYLEGIMRQAGGFNSGGCDNVIKPLRLCSYDELRRVHDILSVHVRRQQKQALATAAEATAAEATATAAAAAAVKAV
jgi:hypothetical protein